MVLRHLVVALGVVCFIGLVHNVVHAGTASALVLERQGPITPDVKPFHEIPVGATLKLDNAGKLRFLHYASCHSVAVAGGVIRFEEKRYLLTGGIIESETPGHCPRRVTLRDVGEIGGGNLRAIGDENTLRFSPRPFFVLVGTHAEDFLDGRISSGGLDIVTIPFDGPQFRWPADARPLTPNEVYELILVPKALGVAKVKKIFRVIPADEEAGSGGELVVLDLD